MTATRHTLKISSQIFGLLQGSTELSAGDEKPGSVHSKSQVRAAKCCLPHCLQSCSNLKVLNKTLEQSLVLHLGERYKE